MRENDVGIGMLLGFFIGAIIAVYAGCVAEHCGRTAVYKEAIAAGVAEYVVDKSGVVSFRFIPPPTLAEGE